MDAGPVAADTLTLLATLHFDLSRRVVEGVVAAGHQVRPSHSVVLGQLSHREARLTELARGANMTPQAMGDLVDELERLGYVARRPDPADRRAKVISLTDAGQVCARDGMLAIREIERTITEALGDTGHRQLRAMLLRLVDQPGPDGRQQQND
jgi:DNA-binding MarR family transcriptional regulator